MTTDNNGNKNHLVTHVGNDIPNCNIDIEEAVSDVTTSIDTDLQLPEEELWYHFKGQDNHFDVNLLKPFLNDKKCAEEILTRTLEETILLCNYSYEIIENITPDVDKSLVKQWFKDFLKNYKKDFPIYGLPVNLMKLIDKKGFASFDELRQLSN